MQPAPEDDEEGSEDDSAPSSSDRLTHDLSIPRHMTEEAVNDSLITDHSVCPPRWEQAQGANPAGSDTIDLLTWETVLEPGETLWAAIAASGAIHPKAQARTPACTSRTHA
eukprot:16436818-Heterocapsa_arctica.AAC.1